MDTNPNGFDFYGIRQIKAGQDGYDFKERLVIADAGCDPLVMDREGAICFALHGMGKWAFHKIAETISQFFCILEKFSFLFFSIYNGNICDDDFCIITGKYKHIRGEISEVAGSERFADGFLKFILY